MDVTRRIPASAPAATGVGAVTLLRMLRLLFSVTLLASGASGRAASSSPSLASRRSSALSSHRCWGVGTSPSASASSAQLLTTTARRRNDSVGFEAVAALRGGATYDDSDSEESEEYDDEYDSEADEEEESEEYSDDSDVEEDGSDSEEDEYDSESEEDESSEEESESDEVVPAVASTGGRGSTGGAGKGGKQEVGVEYDEMLVQGPFESMGVTIGVMLLSKRLDFNDPKTVRIARFAFIAYLIVTQIFLAYVRIKARQIDDRTPITIQNPLSSVLQSQLQQGGDMAKNLASSFLSSETTAVEYDLKQAKSMGNALLMPMAFLWFLHFKMGQTQPLLLQTASGFANLVYSPLFQVYVLGRNLERPFKSKHAPPSPGATAGAEEGAAGEGEEKGDGAGVVAEEEEEKDSEEEEEWTASDESEEEESGSEDGYDSDEYDSDEE